MQDTRTRLETWAAAISNLEFDYAYAQIVEALRADPLHVWHEVVRQHSLKFVTMLMFVDRRAEMASLLDELYASTPEMIFIPGRSSDPESIRNMRARRSQNIENGLSYFLVAAQAKSGSVSFGNAVPQGFGLTCTTYSMINLTVIPSWARDFAHGGACYNTHLLPTPENIDRLIEAGLTKVIVHTRDPRQIYLSALHHADRYRDDYPTRQKSNYYSLTFHERALVDIGYFDEIVDWMNGWANAEGRGLAILYTTFEQFLMSTTETVERILEFYGANRQRFDWGEAVSRQTDVDYHFRLGQADEWRMALDGALIDKMNARIPKSLFEKFGWKY